MAANKRCISSGCPEMQLTGLKVKECFICDPLNENYLFFFTSPSPSILNLDHTETLSTFQQNVLSKLSTKSRVCLSPTWGIVIEEGNNPGAELLCLGLKKIN